MILTSSKLYISLGTPFEYLGSLMFLIVSGCSPYLQIYFSVGNVETDFVLFSRIFFRRSSLEGLSPVLIIQLFFLFTF